MGNKHVKQRREAKTESDEAVHCMHEIYHGESDDCPFAFYVDDKLWDAELELYCRIWIKYGDWNSRP